MATTTTVVVWGHVKTIKCSGTWFPLLNHLRIEKIAYI